MSKKPEFHRWLKGMALFTARWQRKVHYLTLFTQNSRWLIVVAWKRHEPKRK